MEYGRCGVKNINGYRDKYHKFHTHKKKTKTKNKIFFDREKQKNSIA